MNNEQFLRMRERRVKECMGNKGYNETYYHYTTLNAFCGIIENSELWWGSTASMNDTSELTHFITRLQSSVSEDVKQDKIGLERFFATMRTRLDNEYPFVMSLSRLGDDAAQ